MTCHLKNNCDGSCNPLGMPCYEHKPIKTMDNSKDIQVINFAKSHMPDCKVNSPGLKSIKVESEYGQKWEVTFNKKVIPTVMPGIFNYEWEFHSMKLLTSGLKIVKP